MNSHKFNRRTILTGLSILPLMSCDRTPKKLRIGWQTPLATQGQLAAILQRTDILKKHGFDSEFLAFSFGTPQMEAARAGALDVAFVGDQPIINLICSGAPWKIFCRLFDTRVGLYRNTARPWSGPKGATFASPKGTVAHREASFWQKDAGLDPERDVKNLFIDAAEIGALCR